MLTKTGIALIATLAVAPAHADVVTDMLSQMPNWQRCVAFHLDTYGPNQWLGIDYTMPSAQVTIQMLQISEVLKVAIKSINFMANNGACPPQVLMVAPIGQ